MQTPVDALAPLVGEAIGRFNRASELAYTLGPYIQSFVTTDSHNTLARRRESEEALAAELNLSDGSAWSKLQGTITSQLTADFELDGEVKRLPLPALINLRSHPDEGVRRRAYEAELALLAATRRHAGRSMCWREGTSRTRAGRTACSPPWWYRRRR
ncbi:MAG: hypothetical protein SNJ69_10930 [Chloroflexaceae bacterium]